MDSSDNKYGLIVVIDKDAMAYDGELFCYWYIFAVKPLIMERTSVPVKSPQGAKTPPAWHDEDKNSSKNLQADLHQCITSICAFSR